MSCSPQKPNPGRSSWSNLWFKNKKALNNALFNIHLQSLTPPPAPTPLPTTPTPPPNKTHVFDLPKFVANKTSLLSDELLLDILSRLPVSQRNSNSLVSKRWLNLQGRLFRSLKLLDWNFLLSGRIFTRFPNLTHVDLAQSCLLSSRNSGILATHKLVSFHIDPSVLQDAFDLERFVLSVDEIDVGLRVLASGYPNLRRVVIVNASEMGLLSVAEECPTLQELELHLCNDHVLRGIAAFGNLQILKLIGNIDGFVGSLVSDIGLTILGQGCKRLVRLELSGCEGSYDGIKAIGQCCQMLEELTFCDHRMDEGWLMALSYCENLKTLRFLSCKSIDHGAGLDEQLGSCTTLERLHLEKCQLRDKPSARALCLVCQGVREIVIQNCWGLDDHMFSIASICRGITFLSLEGCSMLTTKGLESMILSWKELESLRVVSCNLIKDSEVSPALSTLFSALKELKWRPDSKSLVSASLVGTGMGKRGGKFFKKMRDWKLPHDA
ncbi:hypothetical protein RJ639_033139 [Escallonia herrerae]|uniref:F-box domain-containing protein n=1 Tax=Escallonia herrerae TaxID=1293975 RepID=A0AA88WUU2_9ASTE|nr:hypothetical protein RJ639_033139 [Escallonia herrerae]